MKQTEIGNNNNDSEMVQMPSCSFDPNLYESHWSAKTKLYNGSNISMLDHIYLELRKFVSHPNHSKAAVTESFRSDKLFKLHIPNNSVFFRSKGHRQRLPC